MSEHTPPTLDAAQRARDLERIAADGVDLLVIGGGVTGTGVALDAAARGLRVALVEAADLANGTSRFSSKLAHGGLRYLAHGQVGIAWESARERHLLMTAIAPHLVRPLGQVLPVRNDAVAAGLTAAGFVAGDGLRRAARTSAAFLPGPSVKGSAWVTSRLPGVRRDGLRGGLVNYDGQLIDDARLVVGIARTAASRGAAILTRVRATEVRRGGATLVDALTGASVDVAARAVVNATGVWAGGLDAAVTLTPSRGTHLVLDAATVGNPLAAQLVPVPGSRSRYMFVLPAQLGRVYVGLTDVPAGDDAVSGPEDEPRASDDEIEFLLTTVSAALERPIGRSDVRGTFAGLRPLLSSGASGSTADLSRKHAVVVGDGVTVVGGKLTTYRAMAQEAVDAAVATFGLTAGPCVTETLALVGATPLRQREPLPRSLIARYGGEAQDVVAAARERGIADPLARVADGVDVTRAEVAYAVLREGAFTVDDVLHRRTRIGLVADDADAARPVIEEIASALG